MRVWAEMGRWLFVAVLVVLAGGVVVVWLSPGGLGQPGPVEITEGPSVSMYRGLAGAFDSSPTLVRLVELFGEGCLLVLGVLWARSGWSGFRGRQWPLVVATGATALGTVGAYVISEAVKLVVDEERPCRAVRSAVEVASCPPAGDWSFPSNHATLAAGLAVGLVVTWRRSAVPVVALMAVAVVSRVAAGSTTRTMCSRVVCSVPARSVRCWLW